MTTVESLLLVAATSEATAAIIALCAAFYAMARVGAQDARITALEKRLGELETRADYKQVALMIAHQEALAIGYQEKWVKTHAMLVAERAVRASESQ